LLGERSLGFGAVMRPLCGVGGVFSARRNASSRRLAVSSGVSSGLFAIIGNLEMGLDYETANEIGKAVIKAVIAHPLFGLSNQQHLLLYRQSHPQYRQSQAPNCRRSSEEGMKSDSKPAAYVHDAPPPRRRG
jgi:hypothetical protein